MYGGSSGSKAFDSKESVTGLPSSSGSKEPLGSKEKIASKNNSPALKSPMKAKGRKTPPHPKKRKTPSPKTKSPPKQKNSLTKSKSSQSTSREKMPIKRKPSLSITPSEIVYIDGFDKTQWESTRFGDSVRAMKSSEKSELTRKKSDFIHILQHFCWAMLELVSGFVLGITSVVLLIQYDSEKASKFHVPSESYIAHQLIYLFLTGIAISAEIFVMVRMAVKRCNLRSTALRSIFKLLIAIHWGRFISAGFNGLMLGGALLKKIGDEEMDWNGDVNLIGVAIINIIYLIPIFLFIVSAWKREARKRLNKMLNRNILDL